MLTCHIRISFLLQKKPGDVPSWKYLLFRLGGQLIFSVGFLQYLHIILFKRNIHNSFTWNGCSYIFCNIAGRHISNLDFFIILFLRMLIQSNVHIVSSYVLDIFLSSILVFVKKVIVTKLPAIVVTFHLFCIKLFYLKNKI